jgi:hypothetical protein
MGERLPVHPRGGTISVGTFVGHCLEGAGAHAIYILDAGVVTLEAQEICRAIEQINTGWPRILRQCVEGKGDGSYECEASCDNSAGFEGRHVEVEVTVEMDCAEARRRCECDGQIQIGNTRKL